MSDEQDTNNKSNVTNISDHKGLYQPNLMCWYDVTKDPQDSLRTLIARNKEDIGITEEQSIDVFWSYALDFKRRLEKENKFNKEKKEITIPPCSMALSFNERRTILVLTIASMDANLPITDEGFAAFVGSYCQQMAQVMGIELLVPKKGGANDWERPGPRDGA